MVAYNFKAQFADDVENLIKRQTIRPKRKRPTRAGDDLQLYTGMRTKACRLLTEAKCKSVKPIIIGYDFAEVDGIRVHLDNAKNGEYQAVSLEWLARADGFRDALAFFEFFRTTYGVTPEKPLEDMEIIRW